MNKEPPSNCNLLKDTVVIAAITDSFSLMFRLVVCRGSYGDRKDCERLWRHYQGRHRGRLDGREAPRARHAPGGAAPGALQAITLPLLPHKHPIYIIRSGAGQCSIGSKA